MVLHVALCQLHVAGSSYTPSLSTLTSLLVVLLYLLVSFTLMDCVPVALGLLFYLLHCCSTLIASHLCCSLQCVALVCPAPWRGDAILVCTILTILHVALCQLRP